jgi:hypothetical protein
MMIIEQILGFFRSCYKPNRARLPVAFSTRGISKEEKLREIIRKGKCKR